MLSYSIRYKHVIIHMYKKRLEIRLFQNGEEVDLADAHAEASGDKLTVSCSAIRGGVPTRAEMAQTGWYLVNLYNSADIPARPSAAHS